MIVNRQRRVRVPLRPLELFVDRVNEALGLSNQGWTVCLVSDAEIARMNRMFRGKRGATDVLSFPANGTRRSQAKWRKQAKAIRDSSGFSFASSASSTSSASYLGDIAISPETARRNAHRFGRTLPDELRILILHGVLHLLGYNHEVDQGEMSRLERRLRQQLGLR